MKISFVVVCLLASACCGCDMARDYLNEVANSPAVLPATDVGAQPPSPSGDAAVDVLDIVLYSLAALGLGPVAKILGLARPLIAPALRLFMRRKPVAEKPETPAQP